MLPDQFCNLTWREFMSWRLEDSNQSTTSIPSNGYRGYTSKTPSMNPTRMPINFLHSRKVSREKCHNTQFSKMRSILKLLKGTFWSQQQPMTVRRSLIEVTNLRTIMIVKNSLSRRNTLFTVFSTMYSKVTWVKP